MELLELCIYSRAACICSLVANLPQTKTLSLHWSMQHLPLPLPVILPFIHLGHIIFTGFTYYFIWLYLQWYHKPADLFIPQLWWSWQLMIVTMAQFAESVAFSTLISTHPSKGWMSATLPRESIAWICWRCIFLTCGLCLGHAYFTNTLGTSQRRSDIACSHTQESKKH